MSTAKSSTIDWVARFECEKPLQIKTIEKPFAGIPAGSSMLIVTPKMVDSIVCSVPFGKTIQQADIRTALAKRYNAQYACPVTTGISLRVVSEVAFLNFLNDSEGVDITPFWRAVDPQSALAGKLDCGRDFIISKRKAEMLYTEVTEVLA
jgi:hypothetical protein